MTNMKAIQIKDVGKDEKAKATDLYIGEREIPELKEGDVLVKIKAFGINRMDIMQRQGMYPLPPGVTDILGVEFSGTIAKTQGDKFKEGDEVFGLAFGGAYAEYIAVNEGMVTKKPEGVSWVQAAAVCENWLTAYQALYWVAQTQPGDSVLIHAGASGVGLAAIQLAKAFGAKKVFTTAGSQDKLDFCKSLGADVGINYKEESDFSKKVLAETDGQGVNVAIDFVGANYWVPNLASLAKDGRLVLLGLLSGGDVPQFSLAPILYKRLRIEGTTLRSRTLEYQSKLLQEFAAKALDKVFGSCGGDKTGMELVIHKVYPWTEIVHAHEEMEAAKNTGKIICEIK